MRTDNKKVNFSERPDDITYERYLRLINIFKECRFDEKKIFDRSEFIIQDVLFNTLLQKSNYDLLKIAQILKKDCTVIKGWIKKTNDSFEKKFYCDDFYYDYDMKIKQHIKVKSISGISSLVICNKVTSVINVLKSEFIDISSDNYKISSLSRNHPKFNSINYWRGPTWINMTWMIIFGLRKNNYFSLADKILESCINLIKKNGVYEYYNSDNYISKGCGDNKFSWSAAIFLCMIQNIDMYSLE